MNLHQKAINLLCEICKIASPQYKVFLCDAFLFNYLRGFHELSDRRVAILNSENNIGHYVPKNDTKVYLIDSSQSEDKPMFIARMKQWFYENRHETHALICFLESEYEEPYFREGLKLRQILADLTDSNMVNYLCRQLKIN